jgi:hypothetical protein
VIRVFIFLSIVFFSSCGEKKNKIQNKEETYFDESLNKELINYQKLYPIPAKEKGDEAVLYIYIVSFYKENLDTIVLVKRASDGVGLHGWDLTMGIYQNKDLLPTIIRDSKDFYSKNLVNKIVVDSQSLNIFLPITGKDYPESFPPVYEYKLTNSKLIFSRIDTVWTKWQ